MDGIVVIGEGEKDEAPMLYNGERIGDGTPPRDRHRRRPGRRHHAHRPRPGQRHLGHRRLRAGHDVRPRARASTWRRSRSAPRPPASSTSPRTAHREPRTPWPRPRASRSRDVTAVILDRDRHDDLIAEVRAGRRPHPPHPRRRRRSAPSPPRGPTPAPTSCSASAARPRASSPPPRSSAWAARSRAGCGPATTTSAPPPIAAGYDLDRVLTTDDLVAGRQLLLRRHRHHRRRAAQGRPLRQPGRHHPVAGDALEVGHRPPDQRPPPPRQAPGSSPPSSSADLQARAARSTYGDLEGLADITDLPQPPLLEVPQALGSLARAGRRRRRASSTSRSPRPGPRSRAS